MGTIGIHYAALCPGMEYPLLNHTAVPMASTKLFVGAISYSIISVAAQNFHGHGRSVMYAHMNTMVATSYA